MSERFNLHLFSDEKFVKGAILQFEKYYPRQNIYIINSDVNRELTGSTVIMNRIFFFDFEKKKSIRAVQKLATEFDTNNIFIHSLDYLKAGLVLKLKQTCSFKTYWIFYGADLYSQIRHRHDFFDKATPGNSSKNKTITQRLSSLRYLWRYNYTGKNAIKKTIEDLDYFCFWNEYEYENLKKHFITKAEFRWFIYTHAINYDAEIIQKPKTENIILINHSASAWSNHITILEKIKAIPDFDSIATILLPLNYGKDYIRNAVINYCQANEIMKARFITTFLAPNVYFKNLESVSVAIFGAKRQEGAGNIFYLLRVGAKVYLRLENPLYSFLINKGFLVFCFENDIDKTHSLTPLTSEEMAINLQSYKKIFNEESLTANMKKLIN